MTGIAIVLDLLRKNPTLCAQRSIHSYGFFSATAAASAAAVSVAAGTPFASKAFFRNGLLSTAHCDTATLLPWSEDYNFSSLKSTPSNKFVPETSTKQYYFVLKPLLSAFELKSLAITSLRSFLMFYLPLLEPLPGLENDEDDDELSEDTQVGHVDLIVPFKKSVRQIFLETAVATTRRVLERLAVHYVSQRMAWKLLKDVPKSAMRKLGRGMPTVFYFYRVCRTTFRGHLLGVTASWLVQVSILMYRCFSSAPSFETQTKAIETTPKAKLVMRKICMVTINCGSSLVFASICAGIGASVFRPSLGQWIGCAVGDLSGPVIVEFCYDKLLHVNSH